MAPVCKYLPGLPDIVTSPQSGESYCMDFVGVSLKPEVMRRANPQNLPTAADTDFESYVFRVQGVTSNADPSDKTKELCGMVRRSGLTWAHICDA